MINITYTPWSVRGYKGPVWQIYVEVKDSHNAKEILEVFRRLNDPPHKGLHIAQNKSRALKRLGWQQMDDFYYRIFE